jgi:proline dehydrogenase
MDDSGPNERILDFSNTEIAFSNKTDKELKKMAWLFKLMNKPALVKYGSKLGLFAVKLKLPFAEHIIKSTIFQHFCGGENLLDCQKTIDKLYKYDTLTVLDYGAEGKSTDEDFEKVMHENIRAIEMAASNSSVPVISVKLTGLVDNDVLEEMQEKGQLAGHQKKKYDAMYHRIDTICDHAHKHQVGVFIDAEESWIQGPIDAITLEMMEYYNKERVIVYNTYQLYRSDKLQDLKDDFQVALDKGFLLGAKLVRGAYMEKEAKRAEEMNYTSPIHTSKKDSDKDFDDAIKFCIDHYEKISFCCASHNAESNMLLATLINEKGLDRSHAHLNFCQLYGMSDHITFNLADAGYNVAKYVPYGAVKEVIPYLIRRAQENTSVTGEMSRELALIENETKRRKL